MSQPKYKSENYMNLGGINTKVSPYLTGPHEFLDMVNFDFQTPGSLSTRWGTTQSLATSASFVDTIRSLFEFTKLDGSSFMIFSHSGSIWYGATTGAQIGLSLAIMGTTQTYVSYPHRVNPANTTAATRSNGAFFVDGEERFNYSGAQSSVTVPISLAAQPNTQNQLDYAMFQNFLFMCDGTKFLKFDGSTAYPVGLPPVGVNGLTAAASENTFAGQGISINGSAGTAGLQFGFPYIFYASYVNNRGFQGPIWPVATYDNNASGNGITMVALYGSTNTAISFQLQTPLTLGLSAINLWAWQGPTTGFDQTTAFLQDFKFLKSIAPSGSTFTVGTYDAFGFSGNFGQSQPGTSFLPMGFTLKASGQNSVYNFDVAGIYPRYIETYSNRLFIAGFSAIPSTVYFSDVGEPEGYDSTAFFEVRTNDGDRVTALKSYQSKLMAFKKNSFHELSGDNPDNFFLREVSDQYGCLSNRAITIFNNSLLFLDRKGVMLYNGANITPLSTKIQDVFESMNLSAAEDQATMVHDKIRNQVLLGIPVSGSIVNNLTVVYDYINDAWTKYTGYNPSIYAIVKGPLSSPMVFFGGYSGKIFNYGSSFIGDNGVGFTCMYKTRYLSDMGQSIEKQWRRLYLNVDPTPSVTIPISIDFMKNYGTSITLNKTMYGTQFQSRIDYGISAKSLAYQATYNSATIAIKIHGFTVEYREQRRV